jgi:hypothetical protein
MGGGWEEGIGSAQRRRGRGEKEAKRRKRREGSESCQSDEIDGQRRDSVVEEQDEDVQGLDDIQWCRNSSSNGASSSSSHDMR